MTPIFGCDRRAQKYCETRCFLGVVLHVLCMEGQESMASTVSCKQHRNTTAFIKKKNKNITETTATTTGTAIALGWNSPTRHMFFVSHMCAWKDLTWSSRPDTCEPHCLRIDSTWGIWKKGPLSPQNLYTKLPTMLEMSPAPRSINFQSLLHLRTGQCESEVARVKPADLLFTVSSQTVESDSNPRRHCDIAQCRTYRCVEYICTIYVHVCVDQQSVPSCHWTSASSTWIMFGHSWQTQWAGPCCWYWFWPFQLLGFCGVQPESLLLKLLEIGLKFRKKHT